MSMDALKQQIEQKEWKSLYLFYGDEAFLIDTYRKRLLRSLLDEADELMNLDEMNGPVSQEQVISCAETFPLMVDRRLVIVHDSGFFASGSGDTSDICSFFARVPETTVLVFIEANVDKRSRAYKAVEQNGLAISFTTLDDDGLAKWIMIEARRRKLRVDKMTAMYLLRVCGTDMNDLNMEMTKLFAYKEGSGQIEKGDIDRIVTLSIETNIFHMMDAIGNQQVQEAYRIYRNLLTTGESEYYIFSLVRRQIDMLFKTAVLMREPMNAGATAQALRIQPFVARKNVQQASKFTVVKLKEAMEETLSYDVGIKNGTITAGRAIELLIAKYGSRMARRA